jgi:hypothetical protein
VAIIIQGHLYSDIPLELLSIVPRVENDLVIYLKNNLVLAISRALLVFSLTCSVLGKKITCARCTKKQPPLKLVLLYPPKAAPGVLLLLHYHAKFQFRNVKMTPFVGKRTDKSSFTSLYQILDHLIGTSFLFIKYKYIHTLHSIDIYTMPVSNDTCII